MWLLKMPVKNEDFSGVFKTTLFILLSSDISMCNVLSRAGPVVASQSQIERGPKVNIK